MINVSYMKRLISVILILILLLSACGKEESVTVSIPDYTAKEVALKVIEGISLSEDDFQYVNDNYDEEAMAKYVQGFYGLTPENFIDAAIYRSADLTKADEISIFKLSDTVDISMAFNELEEYRHSRQGDFFGYNPEQAFIVDNSIVSLSSDGAWAAVLICENPEDADRAFFAALGMALPEYDEPSVSEEIQSEAIEHSELGELPEYWYPYVDPDIDDMTVWDNAAIVAAVKAGSDAELNAQGKMLYKSLIEIINSIISDDMSELEKEQAVYKWLCLNCQYDYRHYDIPSAAPRESYEPYGAIINGKAVCLGYATAFQLFMDVLDIECITVVGAAFSSREDHAWNMVKIGGEWYCVDATWDCGFAPSHFQFFNVSSEYMALSDHQWDYEVYPIALPEEIGCGLIHKLYNW